MGWKLARKIEDYLMEPLRNGRIGESKIWDGDGAQDPTFMGGQCMIGWGLEAIGMDALQFFQEFEQLNCEDFSPNETTEPDALEIIAGMFGADTSDDKRSLGLVLATVICHNDGGSDWSGKLINVDKDKAAELLVAGVKEFGGGE